MKYYSVLMNKKSWSSEAISIQEFEDRGYTVKPSRRVGSFQVFKDSIPVAILFDNKLEAMAFIKE